MPIFFWSGLEVSRIEIEIESCQCITSEAVMPNDTIRYKYLDPRSTGPACSSLRVSSYVVLRSSSYSTISNCSSSSSSSSCSASARRCSSSISRFCRSISFSAEMTSRARRTNAGTAPSPAGCQSSSVRTPIPKIASTVLDPVDVRVSVVWYRGVVGRPT